MYIPVEPNYIEYMSEVVQSKNNNSRKNMWKLNFAFGVGDSGVEGTVAS